MSLLVATDNDIITTELVGRIHDACENESQKIDAYLKELKNNPHLRPPMERLTYSLYPTEINDALNYFSATGNTIMLIKINYHPACGYEPRVSYYVRYNDRYFTVITNGDKITSCVRT
jgi:hypothetical protein